MTDLRFTRLGNNPDAESLRLRNLYSDSGVDDAVLDEFETTVMAYQTLPLPFIATRIRERYMGDEPVACGALIVADGQDAGMAIWGIKDFERTANERVETVRGINISAWLLKQHRNKGFARELGRDVVEMAQAQIQNANVPTWSGRQIWTSVHVENTASRLACLGAGFVEAGDHTGSPGRLLYVLGEG